MKELARSSIVVINDLIERIALYSEPESLVYANRLERFCFWFSEGHCVDVNKLKVKCKTAFDICKFYGEYLFRLNIVNFILDIPVLF